MDFSNHYALVIGVSYPYILGSKYPFLPECEKDASAIADVFRHPYKGGYPPENVKTLIGQEATEENLIEAFQYFETVFNNPVNKDGVFTVYFSGHGDVIPEPWENEEEMLHLILADPKDENKTKLFTGKRFAEIIDNKINAKKKLVIYDCCYSGRAITYHNNKNVPIETTVITSSRLDQTSQSSLADSDFSFFTHHLLNALSGTDLQNGIVTLSDIRHYMIKNIPENAPQRPRVYNEDLVDLPICRSSVFAKYQSLKEKMSFLSDNDIFKEAIAEMDAYFKI